MSIQTRTSQLEETHPRSPLESAFLWYHNVCLFKDLLESYLGEADNNATSYENPNEDCNKRQFTTPMFHSRSSWKEKKGRRSYLFIISFRSTGASSLLHAVSISRFHDAGTVSVSAVALACMFLGWLKALVRLGRKP